MDRPTSVLHTSTRAHRLLRPWRSVDLKLGKIRHTATATATPPRPPRVFGFFFLLSIDSGEVRGHGRTTTAPLFLKFSR